MQLLHKGRKLKDEHLLMDYGITKYAAISLITSISIGSKGGRVPSASNPMSFKVSLELGCNSLTHKDILGPIFRMDQSIDA